LREAAQKVGAGDTAKRFRNMHDPVTGYRWCLPASFEIDYGHAWKPEPRQIADGRALVKFRSR